MMHKGVAFFGVSTILSSRSVPFLLGSMVHNRSVVSAFVVHPHLAFQQQQQQIIRQRSVFGTTLFQSSNNKNDSNDDEVVPTWTYVPYDPKRPNNTRPKNTAAAAAGRPNRPPPRRNFSTWTVPKHVNIPEADLEFSFVRSSGSGGQNVNKLSTKVELRFDTKQRLSWMPREVQDRFIQQQSKRISKEGIFSFAVQEHRTQGRNRSEAVDKLRQMVLEAWPRPKIRKQRTGVSKAAKARNKEFKKKRSETKANRKRVDF